MKEKEIKKENDYGRTSFSWMGVILLLFSILGYCSFGRVSLLIKLVCATLVGNWYNLLLLGIAIYGVFLIVQNQRIHFFKEKYMWIYGIVFSLLLLSHINVLKSMNSIDVNHFSFVEDTRFVVENYVDNIFSLWDVGSPNLSSNLGGGVLSALLSSILVSIFTATWATVILIVVIIFAFWTFIRIPIKKKFKKNQESEKKEAETIKQEIQDEPLYDDLVKLAKEEKDITISAIQKKFQVGYNRANRCMELLEKSGIIEKKEE